MESIVLQLVGLMIIITLIILFFLKRNINNSETKIYSKLLILCLVFIIIGIFTFIIANLTNNYFIISIFQKIYMSILTLLNLYSMNYCLDLFDEKNTTKKLKIFLYIITYVSIILVFILPLNVIFDNNILDGNGPSYIITILHTVISFTFFLVNTILLIIYKKNIKKIIPFIILIILYLIGFCIRSIYKSLIFEGFFYSFILFIMYNTIENPDLKLLNEYINNKELAEKNIEDKSNLLFKITQDLKKPINKINKFSIDILNCKNIEDIYKYANDINDISKSTIDSINYIFDISLLDRSKIKFTNLTYNIYNLLVEIIYIVKNKMNDSIDFKYSINNIIPSYLYGDSSKIKQIICSLILKSYKYTKNGTIDLNIDSIVRNDICRLIISISDTGCGMTLDKINNILNCENDSNENLDQINNFELSLNIINKIINMIDGRFLIKSDKNMGTTYYIVIDQLIVNNNFNKDLSLLETFTNKKKVLIVDEDYKELECLSSELKKIVIKLLALFMNMIV